MSTALLVDASCDLPLDYIESNNIHILPITIRIDDKDYLDEKDPESLAYFYSQGLLSRERKAASTPFSSEQTSDYVLDKLVNSHEFALCISVTRLRSPIYDFMNDAARRVMNEYHNHLERPGHFAMRVVNSANMFTGQGLLAVYAVELLKKGLSKSELRKNVEDFKQYITAYLVPSDIYYIRARALEKGEKSVSLGAALAGKMLDIHPVLCCRNDETFPVAKKRGHEAALQAMFEAVAGQVKEGLKFPFVVVSVAGELATLENYPGYKLVVEACEKHQVTLISCVSSLTGGVNMGPGSINISFAAESHPLAK
ncbi:DegV family protein with EDD domain [Sinobacterium caligoides]|uniref:DegV family protein with EDD domain n=1 Tax=Sinobacterium caligoides TaxID=933926 RepID=A0A3N2DNK8_9GAMM|nr:DegV family protein [Sinobacterium caligoides]ROS01272.1 DegV family protein with EDD domain [Sinobacterium caligoides]